MQGFIPQVSALPNLLANGHCANIQNDVLASPANGTTSYISTDMWFLKNTLGTNGVVTGSYNGVPTEYPYQRFSPYARISTAPTASQANGCELHIQNGWDNYTIPSYFSAPNTLFTLKTRVRGLGAVTHIGITPFYNADSSVGKPQTSLASAPEQTFAVATAALPSTDAAFTEVTATFDLSTALTAFQSTQYNMIGFRFRPITVSSGNLYDLANGVQCGRTQLNPGARAGLFEPYGGSFLADLQQCQRFYYKTFAPITTPAQNVAANAATGIQGFGPSADNSQTMEHHYAVPMIQIPTITLYNPAASNAEFRNTTRGSNWTNSRTQLVGLRSVQFIGSTAAGSVAGDGYGIHFTADARP